MVMNPSGPEWIDGFLPTETPDSSETRAEPRVRHWPTRNVPIFGCASFFPDTNRPMPSFDKGGENANGWMVGERLLPKCGVLGKYQILGVVHAMEGLRVFNSKWRHVLVY